MNESLETKINNTIEQYKTICKLEPNNHKVRVDFAIFYTQLQKYNEASESRLCNILYTIAKI